MVILCIKDSFDHKEFKIYMTCKSLLVKSANKDYSAEITYGDDFKCSNLDTQLKTLPFIILNSQSLETFHDVLEQPKKLSMRQKILISEVIKLLKLIILMPPTTAVSERSLAQWGIFLCIYEITCRKAD